MVHLVRMDHPTMGLRDMYYKIRPEGIGRDAFEKLCKKEKLQIEKAKNYRRTTNSCGVVRFPNLMEDLELTCINQLWQSDITYFDLNNKFCYLTFIIDAFSRRIVGHCTSKSLRTEHTTLPSFKMGVKLRQKKGLKGLVLHSDGGGQYYDKEFVTLTNCYGIRNSMCEFAWENGKAERVNGIIKNNYLKHRKIKTFEDLSREVDRSVYLYNEEKPHIELKRVPPALFEKKLLLLQEQTKPTMTESFDALTNI